MNGIKKTLALILSVMLLVGTLASCDMISAGGQKDNVDTSSYTAKVNIKFATDDEKMKSAVDAMNASSVIMVNNGDISVSTTSTTGLATVSEEYILVSDMLYYGLSVSVGDVSSAEYKRAPFGQSRRLELISATFGGAQIDNGSFSEVIVMDGQNGTGYTCSGISDGAREYLEDVMNEKFGGLATAKLSEAYLDLETKGTATVSSVLSCNYVITMGGVEYTVTMRLYTEYDYECETVVSAPGDTGKYVSVSSEEILK